MDADRRGPASAGRRRLAAELRKLRDLAGIPGRDLAQQIGISQSKVSRIESGSAMPSIPEARAWGEALGVSEEILNNLVLMTEAAYTEVHPWQEPEMLGHLQDDIKEQEARAHRVCTFQPSVVPGLLQTAEYARRVFSLATLPFPADEIPAAVSGRLHRQLALYEGRRFDFLITEGALRWRPGPSQILLAQLDRITSIDTLENVSIGLIPHSVEAATLFSHGFHIYYYNDDDDESESYVEIETIHANMIINATEAIALYGERWSLLGRMALFGDDARNFLARLATDIRTNTNY